MGSGYPGGSLVCASRQWTWEPHAAKGASMAGKLEGKKVAFLATEGVEQVELTAPMDAVRDAGGRPVLISLEQGPFTAFNHLDKADQFDAELAVADADPSTFDGLVLPGGVAN